MPATQWDTESTRLLCAAILVDRDLPNRLLRESKAAPRALPAATDVDLATATCSRSWNCGGAGFGPACLPPVARSSRSA